MIDTEKAQKRVLSATEQFESYKDNIVVRGREVTIASKYVVNLDLVECSCKDFEFNGEDTPCKHIIMAWLYLYDNIRSDDAHPFR